MIENLITNVSDFDSEMGFLMILGFGWCLVMIFAPQVIRGFQDAIDSVFGRQRIEGHPLQSLAFYRIIGIVVLIFLVYAVFRAPDSDSEQPVPDSILRHDSSLVASMCY